MRLKRICVNAGDLSDTPKFAYALNLLLRFENDFNCVKGNV